MAKRLGEMHGGSIEARSEGLGKGSAFIVTLPVASAVPEKAAPGRVAAGSEGPKYRVLIADDNRDVTEVFEIMLTMMGHTVESAHDGIEAVEKAAGFHPDVIILDIGMPGLNGYDAARRIRETDTGKKAVLIAITGWGDAKDKRQSDEAGFNHHLVKPVDPLALAELLNSLQSPRPRTRAMK